MRAGLSGAMSCPDAPRAGPRRLVTSEEIVKGSGVRDVFIRHYATSKVIRKIVGR